MRCSNQIIHIHHDRSYTYITDHTHTSSYTYIIIHIHHAQYRSYTYIMVCRAGRARCAKEYRYSRKGVSCVGQVRRDVVLNDTLFRWAYTLFRLSYMLFRWAYTLFRWVRHLDTLCCSKDTLVPKTHVGNTLLLPRHTLDTLLCPILTIPHTMMYVYHLC